MCHRTVSPVVGQADHKFHSRRMSTSSRKRRARANRANPKPSKKPRIDRLKPNRILFSVISVKYPMDFESVYYNIRRNVRDQKVICKSNMEDSSLAYMIRNAKATFQANVQLYDTSLNPTGESVVKTKRGVSVPFIEPFVAYEARVQKATDSIWVDYYVTKIVRMHVLPFSLHTSGLSRFRFMVTNEIPSKQLTRKGLTPRQCEKALVRAVRSRIRGGTTTIVDDQIDVRRALGEELYEEARNASLYYLLMELLAVKKKYEDCLEFDKLVMMRLTQDLIRDLKDILDNRPWEMALPSNWKRFSLKAITPVVFRKMQDIYTGGDSDREFPEKYFWVAYLYEALLSAQNSTKDMYCTYLSLYEAVRLVVWKETKNTANAGDPVIFMLDRSSRFFANDQAYDWFRRHEDPTEALVLLKDDGAFFFCDEPPASMEVLRDCEKEVGRDFLQFYNTSAVAHEWIRNFARFGSSALHRSADRIYRFAEKNVPFRSRAQRIYDGKVWRMQSDLFVQLRLLILKNRGMKSEMPKPKDDWDSGTTWDRLNEKQREALGACVSDQPVTFVEGEPGSGKTEVIRAFCEAMNIQGNSAIMVGGVNGITCNVLRNRLGLDDVKETVHLVHGQHDRISIEGPWGIQIRCMTLDMMYALSKNIRAAEFQAIRAMVHTLIIDEAQNVDLRRFVRVISMFPKLTRLRIFGDFNQIQAICIGQVLFDMRFMSLPMFRITLEENNRVRKYPDSQSIVANFRSMTSAEPFDIDYTLEEGDEGSHFLTMDERSSMERIKQIYSEAADARSISMITPMRVSARRLNAKLGNDLRQIVLRNRGWEDQRDAKGDALAVPFAVTTYTVDRQRESRKYLRAGTKIRFCRNYTAAKVKVSPPRARDVKVIVSDEVYNGECCFIRRVQMKKIRGRGNLWVLHVVFADNSKKKIVVGSQHVDASDITEGWATTIDAMLGGQNETMILYLGRFYHVTSTSADGAQCPVIRNLHWVDRNRLVSAISRAERFSYVFSPLVKLTGDALRKIFEKRERKNGREFTQYDAITTDFYRFDAKMILKLMADLMPRKRLTDVETYSCFTYYVVRDLPRDFMVKKEEEEMDVDKEEEMDVVEEEEMDVVEEEEMDVVEEEDEGEENDGEVEMDVDTEGGGSAYCGR